jgi:hypothetical protein
MPSNIPAWTKAALGYPMTQQQFLASPEAQDAVFNQQFGQAAQKYGPAGAANWWFTGKANPPASANDGSTTAPQYALRFNAAVAQYQPQVTTPPVQAATAPSLPSARPGSATPSSQEVIPGQTDPHKPGFDPSSVPFINTPIGGQQGMNDPTLRPLPPPRPADTAAPDLINGGRPGVYSVPDLGQQGMNDPSLQGPTGWRGDRVIPIRPGVSWHWPRFTMAARGRMRHGSAGSGADRARLGCPFQRQRS